MATAGQPNYFGIVNVQIQSLGGPPVLVDPPFIINSNESVRFVTSLQITGTPLEKALLIAALNSTGLSVKHLLEDLNTGNRIPVNGGSVAPGAVSANMVVNSPAFNPPETGSQTTYKVVTVVQANGALSGIVAAFADEGDVLMSIIP